MVGTNQIELDPEVMIRLKKMAVDVNLTAKEAVTNLITGKMQVIQVNGVSYELQETGLV